MITTTKKDTSVQQSLYDKVRNNPLKSALLLHGAAAGVKSYQEVKRNSSYVKDLFRGAGYKGSGTTALGTIINTPIVMQEQLLNGLNYIRNNPKKFTLGTAIGYGGYKGYKYLKNKNDTVSKEASDNKKKEPGILSKVVNTIKNNPKTSLTVAGLAALNIAPYFRKVEPIRSTNTISSRSKNEFSKLNKKIYESYYKSKAYQHGRSAFEDMARTLNQRQIGYTK